MPYGITNKIITDNGSNINNKMMKELLKSFKIKHHNSSPYHPKIIDVVETANKNIKKTAQKMVKHTRTGMRCYLFPYMDIILHYTL